MIICVVLRSIKLDAVKSALDIFAQSTGNCFKLSVTSYGNDGQKLVNTLVSPDYDKHRKDLNDLVAIIKTNKPWINKLVDMRDEVTHSSDLTGLSSFMFKKIEPNDTKAIVYYPSLFNGEIVSKYMDSAWSNIVNLIRSCLSILVKVVKSRITSS